MNNRKVLFSIFLIVFIDLLGFSLILPLLPFYAETFGASPVVIGLLVAVYAAMQFIGAPILGRLSDRFGRRPILLASIFGTFLGFVLLGIAKTLPLLFFARALDGITGGNLSVAQAYISDVTDSRSRTQALGMIGAAFGLGFIIGPALGGLLSQWGFAVPAFVAAGLSAINLLLVAFWLPESLTEERRAAISAVQKRPAFSIFALLDALRRPLVGPLLHTRFFFGLAFAMFQTIFALYAQARFGLDLQRTGYILAYVGVLSAVTQGFVIGRLVTRYTERQLIFASTVVMAASLLAWAFAPSILVLLLVLIPTSISGGSLNTVINSALTKSVDPTEIGGTLGLASSLESLTRIIAPSLGGLLLEKVGVPAPGVFASVILIGLAFYLWRFIIKVHPTILAPIQVDPNCLDC